MKTLNVALVFLFLARCGNNQKIVKPEIRSQPNAPEKISIQFREAPRNEFVSITPRVVAPQQYPTLDSHPELSAEQEKKLVEKTIEEFAEIRQEPFRDATRNVEHENEGKRLSLLRNIAYILVDPKKDYGDALRQFYQILEKERGNVPLRKYFFRMTEIDHHGRLGGILFDISQHRFQRNTGRPLLSYHGAFHNIEYKSHTKNPTIYHESCLNKIYWDLGNQFNTHYKNWVFHVLPELSIEKVTHTKKADKTYDVEIVLKQVDHREEIKKNFSERVWKRQSDGVDMTFEREALWATWKTLPIAEVAIRENGSPETLNVHHKAQKETKDGNTFYTSKFNVKEPLWGPFLILKLDAILEGQPNPTMSYSMHHKELSFR